MIPHAIAASLRLLTGAQARWIGCDPHPRPRVYFANHTSHLDGPTLWATLPPELRARTRPIAARDYWSSSRLRKFLAEQVFHAILVERKRPTPRDNPLDRMLEALDAGESLILFPEGGRHSGTDPAPFQCGLYHLAKKRPEIELVPTLLDNMNRILPKGEFLPVPLISSVTFGPPVRLETGEPRDPFLARTREAVMGLRTLRRTGA